MAVITYTHDTTGSLQQAQGSDNRLNVSSRTDTRDYYNSRDSQETYSLVWEMTQTNTGDVVLYWKNTDTQGRHLVIDAIGLNSDQVSHFQLIEVTGTGTGTTALPTCLNRSAPRVAAAVALSGLVTTPVTGLEDGVVIDHAIISANGHEEFRLGSRLRIGQGGAIAIKCESAGAPSNTFGVIFGYYE